MKRLALGTVQFGLDYGIANKRGMVPRAEVFSIMDSAKDHGINTLDTAQAYGASEEVLGEYLKDHSGFNVITKLLKVKSGDTEASIRASLARTGVSGFYGVMLHSFDEFESDKSGYEALLAAKEKGLTLKTGFSLYHPRQADSLLKGKVRFDMVQVPYSVLDRRFEEIFGRLKAAGVEIHVRSVFLQGLLLMRPDSMPGNLAGMRPKIEALHAAASQLGVSVPALCIAFALSCAEIDKVVMGVESLASFNENVGELLALEKRVPFQEIRSALSGLSETDENLILPQNWKN